MKTHLTTDHRPKAIDRGPPSAVGKNTRITQVTALQKGFSHRKGAKDAKIIKDEV